MIDFDLKSEDFVPLCDILKRTGLCENGGHAKAVISEGLVKVNGEVELRKRYKTRSGDKVEFEETIIIVK